MARRWCSTVSTRSLPWSRLGEGTGHCSVLRTACLSASACGHEPADQPDGAWTSTRLESRPEPVPSRGSIHSVPCRGISRDGRGVRGAVSSDLNRPRLSSSASPAGTDGRPSDVSNAVITERSFEQEGKAARFAVYHSIRRLLQSGPDAVRRIGGTNARLCRARWRRRSCRADGSEQRKGHFHARTRSGG